LCQEETGRWILTGVVAGGYGCADPSSPVLYTRVSRLRSWIDEFIDTPGRAEEAHTQKHAKTQIGLTHPDNDLTHMYEEHAHSEGKDEHFHVHGKLKHTQNDIGEIKPKDTHTHSHTKSTHSYNIEDAVTYKEVMV